MTTEQLTRFITWLEDQITEAKIELSNAENDNSYCYWNGLLHGYQAVLAELQK